MSENIHQGGGFKLAFVYYNEISWDFTGEILTKLGSKSAATNEIISEMKKKIQKVDDFEESILLDNISFGNRNKYESLNSALIQKKCQRTGEFNPGETVTTVCTFYLPNSVIDSYTGKVSYNNSIGTNYKVNNKYYTPLSYVGEYNIKATLKNLSVLDNNSGYWAGDWSLTFDGTKDESCQINVYGRLYNKSKYIYRPIDLNNPFPSRNAGINWYDWYSISNNKDKLKESYSDLEYSFNLNNEKLSNIKEYNNQKDIEGTGYYNWDDINNSESSFINEYAEKVGDNS